MFPEKVRRNNLLLDLDGPILDVSERYYRVYKKIIEEAGGRPLCKMDYWKNKRDKIALPQMLRASALSGIKADIFRQGWLRYVEKRAFLAYDRVWPYAAGVLKKISASRRLFLVTLRRSPSNLNWQLRKLNLTGYFDAILYRQDNRGDWRVKYELAREAGLRNSCGFFIGDTEIDILSGKKLGLKTIALLSGVRSRAVLKRYKPDYIFNSLKETERVLN